MLGEISEKYDLKKIKPVKRLFDSLSKAIPAAEKKVAGALDVCTQQLDCLNKPDKNRETLINILRAERTVRSLLSNLRIALHQITLRIRLQAE